MSNGEKRKVSLELFYGTKESYRITGRCIGLITAAQYAGLLEKPTLRKKMKTVETTLIKDLIENESLNDMRLVVDMYTENGSPVRKAKFFISEPLDMISSVFDDSSITIQASSPTGCYMIVDEFKE